MAEPMDPAIAGLVETLRERRRVLRLRHDRIRSDRQSGVDRDSGEAAIQRENDEVLDALDEVELRELSDIEAALARADAGRFGHCDTCGEPIAAGRLEALPATAHCIGCAESAESRSAD